MDVKIRRAVLADALSIQKIINRYAEEDIILPRSIAEIHENIQSFFVADLDGLVIGCCCLQAYYPAMGEVRSLAVLKEHTKKGIGGMMLKACLEEAKRLGMKEVFTFTYAPEFFEKKGFKLVAREKIHPKLWIECMKCPKYPDCGEKALKLVIR